MVFSSVPLYLDPPNWQQQHEIQANPQQQQAASQLGLGSSSRGSSSMAERARMAKIPVPEGPLNCPRCDSTNTKFCYFNNYSLTQPRHFCKACRRYWTRGGALRSVPVGGGCRRNKRRKRARSPKPPQPSSAAPAEQYRQPPRLDHHQLAVPTAGSPFSFMASLQNMTSMGSLGLGFGGLTPPQQHQQQQQQQHQQHQLSLFGGPGFGAGLTEPSNPTSSMMMMYPFQVNGGGGVKMEEMRARAGQSRGGGGAAVTDQFWPAHFNNSGAGSANGGGLWN